MTAMQRAIGRIFLFGGLILAVLVLLWMRSAFRTQEYSAVQPTQRIPNTLSPEPLLKTTDTPASVRDRLLEQEFEIGSVVEAMPAACRSAFDASFDYSPDAHRKLRSVQIVNPQEWDKFQATDALRPGLLAFRRLLFYGTRSGNCFVFYQHGGGMTPSYCLALFDTIGRKAVFVGEAVGGNPAEQPTNIQDLKRIVKMGRFQDTGLRC